MRWTRLRLFVQVLICRLQIKDRGTPRDGISVRRTRYPGLQIHRDGNAGRIYPPCLRSRSRARTPPSGLPPMCRHIRAHSNFITASCQFREGDDAACREWHRDQKSGAAARDQVGERSWRWTRRSGRAGLSDHRSRPDLLRWVVVNRSHAISRGWTRGPRFPYRRVDGPE